MIGRSHAERIYWWQMRMRGRGGVRERLEWLKENEALSPAELAEVQRTKLCDLIDEAVRTVPYYTQLFDKLGLRASDVTDISDLRKLPLLSRSMLMANQAELVSTIADAKTLQTNFSTGSTGQRAQFAQDLDFRLWMRAHQLRTYEWCGNWRLGEPFALLWGSEIYWRLRQPIERLENRLVNRREFNTFRLDRKVVETFADELERLSPVLVSSYSNALQLIARELRDRGRSLPRLRAVQATSEPFPPELRAVVSDAFGCAVYDKYGMRETNIVAHESPDHNGMLVQSENVVVEIVDDEGEPCAPGEVGRVVVTTLNNHSMPLIRYETSDRAAIVRRAPDAVLPFPVMTPVVGRIQDLILIPGGGYVDAYFFSYLLMRRPEIHWFQVVQRQPEALMLRLFAPKGLNSTLQRDIVDRIRHHTRFAYRIDFEMLEQMPTSSTGKFRLCVSHLAAEDVGR